MANFKVVISDPKSRKAYQKELDQSTAGIKGKKIGDKVSGDVLGLQGYELEITGGSDSDGFPMRKDVDGAARKKVLLSSAPGFHSKVSGQRKRKSVRGNTISADISQVNTKVIKFGSQPIEKLLGVKEEKKPEEEKKPVEGEKKAEEKPAAAPAEEQPKEEAKIEEKPKEEPKSEEKSAEEKMGVKELDDTVPEKADEKTKEESPEEKKEEKKKEEKK
jgi:small subunit ribosomal protein S6e